MLETCILYYNRNILYFKISEKNTHFVGQLFKIDGKLKLWEELDFFGQ